MTIVSLASAKPETAAKGLERPRNSPLVDFALRGLQRCWLAEHGRWSHIYHLDGRAQPNESVPHSDVFYSLNVLLGLSRVSAVPSHLDLADIFRRNANLLTRLPVRHYALGMALWAAAALDLELKESVTRKIRAVLTDRSVAETLLAQDLGMLLIGVASQTRAGKTEWSEFATPMFQFLKDRYQGGSGLFLDAPRGLRRRFASFATQVYLSLACYHYGDLTGDSSAVAMASACVRKLISLQGPQGEWPWFYDAVGARVLDFYEIYSVHQYGMAPALLDWAQRYDVRGASESLTRGFEWVFGQNQLERMMLLSDTGLSIRSQVRIREIGTKIPRVARAIGNVALKRSGCMIDSPGVGLRLECRSYELGWILWSFGQRTDCSALTDHAGLAAQRA